jgi:transcriptional regulator with XRE-family HTH domain
MMPDSISDSIDEIAMFLRLVGRRVRAARDHRGLTTGQLATRSGLPAETLAGLERGEHGIEVDELHRVADVLGLPTADLLPAEAQVREEAAEALRAAAAQTPEGPAGGRPAGP